MITVRREILEELLNDEKIQKKLRKCKNINDLAKLLEKWAKEKGYRIAYTNDNA